MGAQGQVAEAAKGKPAGWWKKSIHHWYRGVLILCFEAVCIGLPLSMFCCVSPTQYQTRSFTCRTFNTWRSQRNSPSTRKMRLAVALSKLGALAMNVYTFGWAGFVLYCFTQKTHENFKLRRLKVYCKCLNRLNRFQAKQIP